jgi:hypothetical protein
MPIAPDDVDLGIGVLLAASDEEAVTGPLGTRTFRGTKGIR